MEVMIAFLFHLLQSVYGVAHAQAPTTLIPESGSIGSCNFITGEMTFDCIPAYIAYLIEFMFAGLGTVCLVQIIIAGYQIAFSSVLPGGSKEAGQNRLIWSIVGLVASLLSFPLINFIVSSLTGG